VAAGKPRASGADALSPQRRGAGEVDIHQAFLSLACALICWQALAQALGNWRRSTPSALLKAVAEREAAIKRLEAELRKREERPSAKRLPEITAWVQEQLEDLGGLLKTDPARAKSEFRRLNLQLNFHPTEAEPRPYYLVKGQCDLSALVFFYLRSRRQSAVLDLTRERSVP